MDEMRRAYRDLLAYGKHLSTCAVYLKPRQPCSCGLEIAQRKLERALGIPVYPKSYLREGE